VRAGRGAPIELVVRATDETLRVSVANAGGAFDPSHLPGPSIERAGGWGLRIVDSLAHRWGVEPTDSGVLVWFEVDRPQSESSLPVSHEAPPPQDPPPRA
jgi:hypothetical protein